MPEIIKVLKEEIPTLRFVGKKNNEFGHWDEGWKDADGAEWSFENCLCPRYTTPDEQGNVILDYCYFVHKEEAAK